ncbi:hypothetical protein ACOJUR_12830 [Alicyclobacillus tolerans]|uniref:Uncharacterized protein n=2 Tax=Alicyclobacillus tolerans TaxID=90970 RepID=A0ABT9LSG0_9BACL|nr:MULTISPECIES: hypothetical protein [Alicyclobacillus]MDP9727200.1 hypothetical protein [Alicyclobacillus tengchongensis]QRF22961.1 hypothetical protein FY534_04165 [Alicyclobacillus sp. TC]SHK44923.1 hypothetical protein SAMN05443507_1144 [Alicyclobacillus montanus]
MPVFVMIGNINSSTPQQNANGILVGEFNFSGWDANMKYNAAYAGNYGVFNFSNGLYNMLNDGFEGIDGVINDQDFKPDMGGNM